MQVPRFETTTLVTDDAVLAARVSSLFTRRGRYFSVMDGPRMTRSDQSHEVTRRLQAAQRSECDRLILAGLPAVATAALKRRWPKALELADVDEVRALLKGSVKLPKEQLRCGPENIGSALYAARLQRKELVIDAEGPSSAALVHAGTHLLVACEAHDALAQVAASNLAFAYGASFLTFPLLPKAEHSAWVEDIYALGDGGDVTGLSADIAARARAHFNDVDLSTYQAILFVTFEFPWGVAFPEVPTTHMYSYPEFGRNVVAGLWASQSASRGARNALLIEPKLVEGGEVAAIAKVLNKRGCLARVLTHRGATVSRVTGLLDLLPHDVVVISSHAGDAQGERVTYLFDDDEGRPRTLVVDETTSVAPDPVARKFQLTEFVRFASLDGVSWDDDEGKQALVVGSAILAWERLGVDRRKHVVRREDIARVRMSMAMLLHDGPWLFFSHGFHHAAAPLVLSNCCWSWHEIGARMMVAGARGYVGALYPVTDGEAQALGEALFRAQPGEPTFTALWRAQREVYVGSTRRPYAMLGLPSVHVPVNVVDSVEFLNKTYVAEIAHWTGVARRASRPDVEARANREANFLVADLQIFRKVVGRGQ
jgi:hypothetical protein